MTANAKTFTRYLGELARHKLYSLHIDDDDMMWIGTLNGGLLRLTDKKTACPTILSMASYLAGKTICG